MGDWAHVIYGYALLLSLVVSLGLTWCMRRLALRLRFTDDPEGRKAHAAPTPLLGGLAIVGTFYLVVLGHIAVLLLLNQFGQPAPEATVLAFLGENARSKVAGVLAAGLVIAVVGLVDDWRPLSPLVKLFGQLAAAVILPLSGIQLEAFILPGLLGVAATILWVLFITNALNFLDNMDGLCAGVALIAAAALFVAVQPFEQQLVRLLLVIFAGAVGGFLYFNLNPARIFMGDTGALFIGFMLATFALLGTFHVETTPTRAAVFAPVLALSVPLFDTFSVLYIRWRAGQPLWRGDNRHFSHRLVELGMTQRQAVEFIYLVAGVVGLGAALLPLVGLTGTVIIVVQSLGVFLLIVLLMNTGRGAPGRG